MKKLIRIFETKFIRFNRVYIVPTKLGLSYILVNLAIFMMALFYANNITLLVSFFITSFLIITMISTNHLVQNVKVESIKIPNHFANSKNVCNLKTNDLFNSQMGIKLLDENHSLISTSSTNIFSFKTKGFKRGHYIIKKVKLYSTSSFDLFYAWKYLQLESDFFVYPQLISTSLNKLKEDRDNNFLENGEFSHHIGYKNGLGSNKIDWKIYAKRDELYWRKHESYNLKSFHFDLDNENGDLEQKLSKLSFLIFNAYNQNLSWSLKINNSFINLNSGSEHYIKCMKLLARQAYE